MIQRQSNAKFYQPFTDWVGGEDAEIKARLERVRGSRKTNEEKLTKAQEELRALLDVRQEAVAVMLGLLP